LAFAEIAAQAQLIVELVGIARTSTQLALDVLHRACVEEVAELLLSEQLAQQVAVERQRLRAPLSGRGVVLVHVGGDVVEEQRRRVRRRRLRLDLDEVELAGPQTRQEPSQGRKVEHVLQTFAVGLEDDRKRAVASGDLEQALRLQTLLPERSPLIGAPARDEESPSRVLAKACAEERALADLLYDELLDLVR